MAVFFDAAGVGANNSNGTAVTWQHIVSGSATAMVVAVSFYGVDYTSVTRSVRIGTSNFTSLGITYNYGTIGWTELFGLINPPTGAQIIAVNTSVAGRITANSVSYTGVKSFSTASTSRGSAMPASVSINTTTASRAVAAFGSAFSTPMTLNPTGSVRWNTTSGIPSMTIEDTTGTGSAVSIGISSSNMSWGAVAVNLVAAVIVPQAVTASSGLIANITPTASLNANTGMGASLVAQVSSDITTTIVGPKFVDSTTLIITAEALAAMKPTPWYTDSVRLDATLTRTASIIVTPTPIPTPPAHSPLNYVGRFPDTALALANRKYAVLSNSDTTATIDYVTQALNAKKQYLVTKAFVDQEDAKKVTKTTVQAADQAYFPATGHGLAVTNANGVLPSSAIPPGLVSDRVTQYYAASVNLGSDTRVTTANATELLLATINIPDQGYAWVPIVFGRVRGYDTIGANPYRWAGTGVADATGQIVNNNTGILTVIGSNGAVYGSGATTASAKETYSLIVPNSRNGATPAPVNGPLTLRLYGSHRTGGGRTGEGYTFSPIGLVFYVVVMPSV